MWWMHLHSARLTLLLSNQSIPPTVVLNDKLFHPAIWYHMMNASTQCTESYEHSYSVYLSPCTQTLHILLIFLLIFSMTNVWKNKPRNSSNICCVFVSLSTWESCRNDLYFETLVGMDGGQILWPFAATMAILVEATYGHYGLQRVKLHPIMHWPITDHSTNVHPAIWR